MPQAIGIVALLGSIITPYALVAALAINSLINTLGALFGRHGAKPSDGQQNIAEAVGSRVRNYGIVHTGGQRTFMDSIGGRLGIVITLGTGREGEILEHRINDKKVTVIGGTVTEASFHGAVHIYTRSGTDDQTAIGEVSARFPSWTADHRQRGCAHAGIICDPVKQEHFSEVFNGQIPQYTQIRRGVFVYDPRKDSTVGGDGPQRLNDPLTWGVDDNAALVIADYFAHPDGYGGGYENVNWDRIALEADIADQELLTVTGETIARWRLWASYKLATTERRQVMSDMLKACDGFSWQGADGKFNLTLGRFVEPSVVITDAHIRNMTNSLGPQARQRVSAIKALYTEAAIGYREQESATIADPDAVEDPNTDPQSLELYYAPHHNQAVRLGKIALARLGDRWHLSLRLNLFGLNLLGERFCRVVSALAGIDGYFVVTGLKLNLNPGENTIDVTLDEVKPEDWDFDAATEEGTPPNSAATPTTPISIEQPAGLVVTVVGVTLNGATGYRLSVTWAEPNRPDLSAQLQYRPIGTTTWLDMATVDETRSATSGVISLDLDYEVQARFRTLSGRASAWTPPIPARAGALTFDSNNWSFDATAATFDRS